MSPLLSPPSLWLGSFSSYSLTLSTWDSPHGTVHTGVHTLHLTVLTTHCCAMTPCCPLGLYRCTPSTSYGEWTRKETPAGSEYQLRIIWVGNSVSRCPKCGQEGGMLAPGRVIHLALKDVCQRKVRVGLSKGETQGRGSTLVKGWYWHQLTKKFLGFQCLPSSHWRYLCWIKSNLFMTPIMLWNKHSFSAKPSTTGTKHGFQNPFLPIPEHSVTSRQNLKREDPGSKET